MDNLEKIAQKILLSQSFSYNSFTEAYQEIRFVLNGDDKYYEYDRLSLCFYQHNLTPSEFFQLGKYLSDWNDSHNKEEQKTRIEYGILFHYAQLHSEYMDAIVQKRTRPDFSVSLKNGQVVGIEVTRFTTESDSLISKIIKDYAGQDLTASEIYRRVNLEHGHKVRSFSIGKSATGGLWCFDQSGFLLLDDPFVDLVNEKIHKYIDFIPRFDKFVILCSALSGITITSEYDAMRLIDKVVDENSTICASIAVLFIDAQTNKLDCSEIYLS